MLSYIAKHSKQRKSTKRIKLQWITSIWCQNDQKCWVTSQNIQNNAKLRKWSNYNELHRFEVKTIQNVQNIQHNTKQQKSSNYNELHRFDVKTIKNVELHRKTFKTTQKYKTDQITMNCIDLMSKRSKMLSYVAKHSKQRKTTKVIKLQWIASIWRQNDKKCWVMSQNIQNNAKLQNWSNYNVLHRFDVKTIKNVELRRKTFKTTQNNESDHIIIIASIWRQNHQNFWVRWQNYKSNQITMNCIDLMSKR